MRPMVRTMLAGAAVLLATGASSPSDERPSRYDVDDHCSRLANTSDGFSSEVMQSCLSAQGDALDQIKRIWPGTPQYIREDCDARSRAHGDEDYVSLDRCIRDQLRQAPPDVVFPGMR